MEIKKLLEGLSIAGLSILSIVMAWWLISVSFPGLMPLPTKVFNYLIGLTTNETSQVLKAVYLTLVRVTGGFFLALLLGILFGVVSGRSGYGDILATAISLLIMSIPSLVIILSTLMILGVGDITPILAAAIVVCPFVIVPIRDSLRAFPRDLLEMAESFGASLRQKIRHLYIPHLVPAILGASRIAYSLSWKIVLLTEVFGMTGGIGWMVSLSFYNYSLEGVISWLIVFLIIVFAIEQILYFLEKKATAWR